MARKVERGRPLEELVKGSLDYTMEMIRSAFYSQFPRNYERNETDVWIVEMFGDHIIVGSALQPPDEFYRVTYQANAQGGYSFAAREQWEVVELAYQPRAVAAAPAEAGVTPASAGVTPAEGAAGNTGAEEAPSAAGGTPATSPSDDTPQTAVPQPVSENAGNSHKQSGEVKKRLMEQTGCVAALDESADGRARTIRAVGITADVINANRRRYPAAVLQAAVDELKGHLHESAGQGRWLLGEAEHPSDKASRRPTLLETVVRWSEVSFVDGKVQLRGQVLETSKGKDILAILQGGVLPGVSQRGYGLARTVEEDGEEIEEICELHITGYDLVMEPSDPNGAVQTLESLVPQEEDMDPKQLAEWIKVNPELFKGLVAEEVEKMSEGQLQALEGRMRQALGIDEQTEIGPALAEAMTAKRTLEAQKRQQAVEAAIAAQTKDLPYGELNGAFVEALRAANPETPAAVEALAKAKRSEYDAIVAKARLAGMGLRGVQALGPVLESESDHPGFARGAFEFSEALVQRGLVERRDLRKPRSVNESFAARVLERFDALYQMHLEHESKMVEEAAALTADLSLPYSVARTVIAAALPRLISSSLFDFGVTDQSPTRIYYETFAGDDTLEIAVSKEAITTDAVTLKTWISLANKRIKPATVVVTNQAEGVTYVEGTDYVIDYAGGQLMPVATITTGQALKVSYTYYGMRKGENQGILRAKMTLSHKTLEIAADRLATQLTNEVVVFSRSQIGWDATTRVLSGLINEIQRRIDQGVLYLALSAAMSVANNSGGTYTVSGGNLSDLVKYLGVARVKLEKRYYEPHAILLSTTNSDLLANWDGFTAAGKRPDVDLNANGYVGRVKGLPVFQTTEFSDGYGLVVNRELVAHRVYQPMTIKGPYPSFDASGNLVAKDQWYVEEYNGTAAPVAEKGSYIKIA